VVQGGKGVEKGRKKEGDKGATDGSIRVRIAMEDRS
jgi:hypothetical protein